LNLTPDIVSGTVRRQMNALDDDRLLTFEETAEYLNVSESSLRRMIANREIHCDPDRRSAGWSHSHPSISTPGGDTGMAKQLAPSFPFAPDEIVEALVADKNASPG
jgi:hypothetical protein